MPSSAGWKSPPFSTLICAPGGASLSIAVVGTVRPPGPTIVAAGTGWLAATTVVVGLAISVVDRPELPGRNSVTFPSTLPMYPGRGQPRER